MVETAELDVGDEAPGFCLPDQDEEEACLRDFRGGWVVLYFYPKDNSKGCTLEAIDEKGMWPVAAIRGDHQH